MKQTAVDYLFEKLWGIHKDKFTWQMILKEAKKKEKRQIEDAFDKGVCEGFDYATIKDIIDSDTGKQYYYETYGKNA
jgi:hypothetical protein